MHEVINNFESSRLGDTSNLNAEVNSDYNQQNALRNTEKITENKSLPPPPYIMIDKNYLSNMQELPKK